MNISESIRNDFTAFVQKAFRELKGRKLALHCYIEHLCHQIAKCSSRHVVNVPPRHLKTTIGAICLSAWTLGREPNTKIMVLAGSEELAEEISRPVRDLLRTAWFMRAFPMTRLSKTKSRKMDFATTMGGGLFAASIHSNVTGFGADLIIADDLVGIRDAANLEKLEKVNLLFDEEVLSRLNNHKEGKVIVIMHRLHENDLCGHLWQKGGWTRTVLALIAPRTTTFDLGFDKWKRKKGDVLRPDAYSQQDIRQLQKSANFQLLWQQNPLGNSFRPVKRRHFGTFNAQPEVGVVLSIDPSFVGGSDCSFNVIQAWCRRGDDYLLIDQWREQCGYNGMRKRCLRMMRKDRPAVILVERTGNGAALLDEFHARGRMIPIVPEGTKLDRFRRVSELIHSGKVLLNEDAPWREEFLEELTQFPAASTDDQTDAATQALSWLRERPSLERPAERALGAKSGKPLPTEGNGVVRGSGFVGKHHSNYAPNGPFIQPKVWVRR